MKTFFVLCLAVATALARVEEPPPPVEEQLKPSDLKPIKPLQLAEECHAADVDLVFVVDASGSIGWPNFQTTLKFLESVSTELGVSPSGSHVGVVTFTSRASNAFWLNDHTSLADLKNAISHIKYTGGGTYIAGGMDYALRYSFTAAHGDRDDISDVMIVLTDGQDGRTNDVRLAYQTAHARGIMVLAIGVGSGVNQAELLAIAGGNSSHVFNVAHFDDLSKIQATICVVIDEDHPCDPDPCNGNGVCHPNGKEFTCTCNTGYTGKECAQSVCYHGGQLQCICPFGWTGAYCHIPVNYCDNTTVMYSDEKVDVPLCQPHGHCGYNSQNGSYCICDVGWAGIWCEINIDACAADPCKNGGTCIDSEIGMEFTCKCDQFHDGPTCDHNKDFCHHLEVLHDGTIINLPPCGGHGDCIATAVGGGVLCFCHHGWTGMFCETQILYNCTWVNGKTYPHNSSWVEGCNTYTCEYGIITQSKSLWCPQRCALYNTTQTLAHGLPDHCPPNENCIPDNVQCAKPRCDYPIGWCMPVGMVMVDTITFPTNPPRGYKTFARK